MSIYLFDFSWNDKNISIRILGIDVLNYWGNLLHISYCCNTWYVMLFFKRII